MEIKEMLDLVNKQCDRFLSETMAGELARRPDVEFLRLIFRHGLVAGVGLAKSNPDIVEIIG